MMSTAERYKRIQELFEWANNHNVTLIDPILNEALTRYPMVRKETAHSYAESVLRMIRAKKKGGE